MQTMRQIFGWLFGLCSIIALGVGVQFLRRGIVQDIGVRRLSTIIASCVIVSLALVFAMAWWTTWKAKPTARAWGITASLSNMIGPLLLMYFRHQPLTDSKWKVIAFSSLALISYAWPISDKDSLIAEPSVEDDSAPL